MAIHCIYTDIQVNGIVHGCEVISKWWHVDLFNRTHLDSAEQILQGKTPTRVLFDGEWVETSNNVGYSAKKGYGPEIYQHKDYSMTYHQQYTGLHYVPCPDGQGHDLRRQVALQMGIWIWETPGHDCCNVSSVKATIHILNNDPLVIKPFLCEFNRSVSSNNIVFTFSFVFIQNYPNNT